MTHLAVQPPTPVTRPNGKVWRGRNPLYFVEFGGHFGDDLGLAVFGTHDIELAAQVVTPERLADYEFSVEDGRPDWWRRVPWDATGGGYDYSWITDPERGTPCVVWAP